MQQKYKIGLHVLVWLLIFANRIIPGYYGQLYTDDIFKGLFSHYFIIQLAYFSTSILTFYFTAYLVAPAFFGTKWIKGVAFTLLFFIVSTAYRYIIEFYVLLPLVGFHNYKGHDPEFFYYLKNNVSYVVYSNFIYGFVFFLVTSWYRNNRKQKELEKEKITAELSFLKSQINPHFLFNTLNDIYTLTYQKSDVAPDALLKLSDLLRYMIKDSGDDQSLLEKEVAYLNSVIELHSIGQKGAVYVDFHVDGTIGSQKIAPLILINFIENAFKHGVVDDPEHPIKITLCADLSAITFSVKNKKNIFIKDHTGGIGLRNVRRRLELIYPGKHQLEITNQDDFFNIELKIDLLC